MPPHAPLVQTSFFVQGFASSQLVPFGFPLQLEVHVPLVQTRLQPHEVPLGTGG